MSNNLPASAEAPPLPAPAAPGDGAAFPPPPGELEGAGVRRLFAAVLRYRWMILAAVVVGGALGYAGSRFVDPQYAATAKLWIEVADRDAADRGPIRSGQLLQERAWIDLLKSYAVLDHVVRERRLFLEPSDPADAEAFQGFVLSDRFRPGTYRVTREGADWVLRTAEGTVVHRAPAGSAVGGEAGFSWTPPVDAVREGHPLEFTLRVPRDVGADLASDLDASISVDGRFLTLSLQDPDPQRATATLNAVVDRFVSVALDLKRIKLDEEANLLRDQLDQAAANLEREESSLESFRVSTITLPSDRGTPVAPGVEITQDPVFQSFFKLNMDRDQVRRDREAIRRALTSGPDGGISSMALEIVPAVRSSSNLSSALQQLAQARANRRTLLTQFTEEHRSVRQATSEIETLERRTIPQLATQLLSELEDQERAYGELVASASTDLRQIPPRAIEEARRQRSVAIAVNLYQMLQQRYEEARLAAATTIPDVRVLDAAAVPQEPVSDPRLLVILACLGGTVGLALLGAVLLDRMDTRFHYPEQVTQGMGLAILGAVPALHRRLLPGADAAEQALESFRVLRLSLVHAHGAAGPLVVTVTSPGSGEGKSFVSSNLAIAFADAGSRVLLVDGDVRRGTQHQLLQASRRPGLTDYLAGRTPLDTVVRRTSYERLDLIPCGSRMRRGPELLGSPEMRQLLLDARNRYDVIVVDSPPLAAGADPMVLGTLTQNMLLVMRAGATDRALAESKLDMLDRLPLRVLGAVLNDVSANGVYRYYGYEPGYELPGEDEPEDAETPRLQPAGTAAD